MNESSLLIRAIEAADAEAVSELCSQLGYTRLAEDVAAWVRATANSELQAAFVAELDEQVVGWIEVSVQHHLQSPPAALIGGLVVREGTRGSGIGKRLCDRAEAWALERSVNLIRVTSRSTRADAHRFYIRDGYREIKTSLVFEKRLINGQAVNVDRSFVEKITGA